ncbi:MAG: MarR family transcriptional regulator [Bacteroidetes bacterium]|nr:MarR family transcriptional regulator [Bacteroidota bacterium]
MAVRLEDEIKQKSFRNPYQKLIVNLLYTGGWMSLIQSGHLKPFGLSLPQYNVMRILRGQYPNPCSINLIIDRMLDKASNASRIVDKLVIKKLAERNTCEKDRRAVDVVITKKGLDLLAEIDRKQDHWEEQFHGITEKQADKLNELLDKFRGNDFYNF